MNRETFFDKFEQLADAPGAVVKMRELVLRMATSGRIAEQDSADQPGSDLLREIFKIRDDVFKRGAAKSRIEGKLIVAGDTITLPSSWARCMISEVCDLQTGATPSRTVLSYFGGDTPWLVSGDINKGEITDCEGRITAEGIKNSNCKVIPTDSVLIALNGQGKTRATVALLRIPAALNQSLVAMTPFSGTRLLPEYIFWNLRGRYFAIRDVTGQDQRRGLNMKLVGQLSIPIPPLAEQKRIVAKVNELMALCDQLEAQQQEREARHSALARASLARFAVAPTPANLEFLFHKSYTISPADLRKAILTLAVQGKLVPQDPNDEPAFGALLKHGVDMKRWAVTKEEERQEVPSTWTWIRFAGVGEQRLGKMLDAQKNRGEAKPYLRNTNVQWMRFDLDDVKRMRVEEREVDELRLRNGDLLICEGGEPGRCAIWRDEVREMYFQKAIHRVRPCVGILSEYLALNLQVDCQNGVLLGYFTGATIKHLTGRSLSEYPVPIPPLAEQCRIVAKVDHLMALVDELETQLAASRATAASLLGAVISDLTLAA